LVPDNIDDVSAAGLPVAYLTAQMALNLAGFQAGKTVLSPAIGGSVGNAVTQLARAQGAKRRQEVKNSRTRELKKNNSLAPFLSPREISTTTNHAKAEQAGALGSWKADPLTESYHCCPK
jgi:NADPH2:quinone reductase